MRVPEAAVRSPQPTPRLRGRYARGFTLVELMVVIVIIGVMLSMAVLSIGDGGRSARIETEARRLATLIDLAGEEAILNGRELGLYFGESAYRFLAFDGSQWLPVTDDPLLKERPVPEAIALELVLEGLPVALDDEAPEVLTPHLMFASSGERTPFVLEVGAAGPFGIDEDGPLYRIDGPPFGEPSFASVTDSE